MLCTGTIYFMQVSVHGPSVFIINTRACEYVPVHTMEVPKHLWATAFRETSCIECGADMSLKDRPFTSVVLKAIFGKTKSGIPLNTLTCTCADCVQDKIPEGQYRESFIAKRRNLEAARSSVEEKPYVVDPRKPLQKGLVWSQSTGGWIESNSGSEGSKVLH